MFIVSCFSRDTRNTTATSEEVTTLAKSSRRDVNVTRETVAAVTVMANQNRAAIGSVQTNKTSVAPSNANALATAITRRVLAPGMVSASVVALIYCRQRRCHLTVIKLPRKSLSFLTKDLGVGRMRLGLWLTSGIGTKRTNRERAAMSALTQSGHFTARLAIEFDRGRSDKECCSNTCRMRAYRKRKGEH